ncbi:MAG: antibiotic biosynthesis monooxygenase [Duganella sp.]
MIAVIFEVVPSADGRAEYLERAAQLAPLLALVDGLMSIERFTSLSDPGKVLSLSFWRDEGAVRAWREQEQHRAGQAAGRAGLCEHYRLRVADVMRDYGLLDREQAPPIHLPAHPPHSPHPPIHRPLAPAMPDPS